MTINIIIVTYGKRFNFLEKTLDAVIFDARVTKIILVDNDSENNREIDRYIKCDLNKKIILIRNTTNEGSAGGFRKGVIEAQKNKSDYVLFLDDDNVIEDNWSEYFINILNLFPDNHKIILKSNRNGNFLQRNPGDEDKKVFKIDYIGFNKIKRILIGKTKVGCFQPIIYQPDGFISYGGTLLPFEAILSTEPPLEKFYLYCDDAEYSFRIKEVGYKTYQTFRPIITDVDQTFSKDSKFLTSFDRNVSLVKLFFRIRNQYALALMTKSQTRLSIIINGIIGTLIKITYAFLKIGINKFTLERSKILFRAFSAGVNLKFDNEENVKRYMRK